MESCGEVILEVTGHIRVESCEEVTGHIRMESYGEVTGHIRVESCGVDRSYQGGELWRG